MDTFVNNNQYSFFQYLVITGIKEKTVLPITEIQVQKRSQDIVCYERSSTKKKKTRGINLNILLTCT